MLELVGYPRACNFKTFIVCGGRIEFVRALCEKAYGISLEEVSGCRIVTRYQAHRRAPRLFAEIVFDDGWV
jgi:hypothetical protein